MFSKITSTNHRNRQTVLLLTAKKKTKHSGTHILYFLIPFYVFFTHTLFHGNILKASHNFNNINQNRVYRHIIKYSQVPSVGVDKCLSPLRILPDPQKTSQISYPFGMSVKVDRIRLAEMAISITTPYISQRPIYLVVNPTETCGIN